MIAEYWKITLIAKNNNNYSNAHAIRIIYSIKY